MAIASKSSEVENCSLSTTCNNNLNNTSSPEGKKALLTDINANLICNLCTGYFIDATTIVECLHSFCRSCIVKYLESSEVCPICDKEVHKTKPVNGIRSDKTLQDIVYKLVPGLFKSEMERRRQFYANHPAAAESCAPEERGEPGEHEMFYTPQDKISLSLEYGLGENQIPNNGYTGIGPGKQSVEEMDQDGSKTSRRYLLCPAGMQVSVLKKFIVRKYELSPDFKVDIMYLEDVLRDEYNLMDVAYIYSWRRNSPMRLFYRIKERPSKHQQMKVAHLETQMFSTESLHLHHQLQQQQQQILLHKNNKQKQGVKKIERPSSVEEMRDSPLASVRKAAGNGQAGAPSLNFSKSQPKKAAIQSKKKSCSTSTMTEPSSRGLIGKEKESTIVKTNGLIPGNSTKPSKEISMSSASLQTDTFSGQQPAKKLRKILPANSSVPHPKAMDTSCEPKDSNCLHTVKSVPTLNVPRLTTSDPNCKSNSSVSSLTTYRLNCNSNNNKRKASVSIGTGGSPAKIKCSPLRVVPVAPAERLNGSGKSEKMVKCDKSESVFEKPDKGTKTDYHVRNNQKLCEPKNVGIPAANNKSQEKAPPSTVGTPGSNHVNKSQCNPTVKSVSTVATLRNIRVTGDNRKIPSLMISKVSADSVSSSSNNSGNDSTISHLPSSHHQSVLGFNKEKSGTEKEHRSEKSGKNGKSDTGDKINEKINKQDFKRGETSTAHNQEKLGPESCDAPRNSSDRRGDNNSSCSNVTSLAPKASSLSSNDSGTKTNSTSSPKSITNSSSSLSSGNITSSNNSSTNGGGQVNNTSAGKERKVPCLKISTSRCNESGHSPRRQSSPSHSSGSSQLVSPSSGGDKCERNSKESASSSSPNEAKKQKSSVHAIIEYLNESKKCPKSPTTSGSSSFVTGSEIGVNFHSSVTSKGITIVRDVNRNSVASSSSGVATTVTSPSSGTAPVSIAEIKNVSSTPPVSGCTNNNVSANTNNSTSNHGGNASGSPKKNTTVGASVIKEPSPERLPVPLRIPKVSSIMSSVKQHQSDLKIARNTLESGRKQMESTEDRSLSGDTPFSVSPPPTPSPKASDDSSMLPSPPAVSPPSPAKDNAAPLDLSFGNRSKPDNTPKVSVEKLKMVSNPAVYDKHRFLCPPRASLNSSASKHPSFKISPSSRPPFSSRFSSVPSVCSSSNTDTSVPCSKKEQTMCSPSGGETVSGALGSNSLSRANSNNSSSSSGNHHHHHHHHHHRKPQSNLTVITPDPHSHHQKIVIKKLDPRQ